MVLKLLKSLSRESVLQLSVSILMNIPKSPRMLKGVYRNY